ncbi:MAG TPA: protein kinase [Thermoanaerobaculia bacterium]|nr:protein kinase [Thermoanaerobaculia bacterium]
MVGEVLAHYRIAERLGEGGMGEVFRAEDLKLRRPVALKVLRGAEDQEGRLLREARFASQLNHPNIAVVYDVDTVERDGRKQSFIAMEYVEGRTLSAILKERAPDVPETVDIVLQVADALASAHARGVVHRDVKPGNVMLDGRGRVKVLDFGLAAFRPVPGDGSETWSPIGADPTRSAPGSVLGTVAYMSPEQALGRDVDTRTDVFSLGVLLWELLAGRRPFEGANTVAVIDAMLHAEPPSLTRLNPAVPRELEALALKMLAKDRDRRATMRDVARELSALAGGSSRPGASPVSASPAENAIAVLAFTNITQSPEDNWLGTGIMETVTADLKNVPGLTVIGCERVCEVEKRLTGQTTHGASELAIRLGREVGARRVVTGGFQGVGDVMRITARVTDVESGEVVTTVKVDGSRSDLFALQDRVVTELAGALHLAGKPVAREPEETHVIDAYEAYSKGLINLRAESRQSVDLAILFFERAVALDPLYARAWLALGEAYEVKATYLAMPELLEKAMTSFGKSLALQPRLARAWKELGSALVDLGREDKGLEAIRRSLELDPGDAAAHASLARAHFIGTGRFQDAAEAFERALALNPQGGWFALQLAHVSALLRDFPRAERAARQAIELQERGLSGREGVLIVGAYMKLGQIRALQGRPAEALEAYEKELSFLRRVDHALKDRAIIELHTRIGSAHLALGHSEDARQALTLAIGAFEDRLRVGADEPFTRYYVAAAWALLGEPERALDVLEAAAAMRRVFIVERARIDPDFESLRSEPRFARLLGSSGSAGIARAG